MKNSRFVVLAAIVLGTSACASNTARHQPLATLIRAQSPTEVRVTLLPDVAQPAMRIVPLPRQESHASDSDSIAQSNVSPQIIVDSKARFSGISVEGEESRGEMPGLAVPAERGTEVPYSQSSVSDPWEGFNRKMHGFNTVLDRFVLRPVAVAYNKVIPDPVQSGVTRFFANLRLPATAFNQVLQGRSADAGQSLGRFVVNTTVGIAGVFDPASSFGVSKRDGEDFGQTLASWGWRDSRYLVMPLLGPRTVRDTIAIVGDMPLSPIGKIDNAGIADKLQILQMVDGRSHMLAMDQARMEAPDDYLFVRDTWAQRRNRQIAQDFSGQSDEPGH